MYKSFAHSGDGRTDERTNERTNGQQTKIEKPGVGRPLLGPAKMLFLNGNFSKSDNVSPNIL